MNDRISVDILDGVADVRLIRADKMNALDNAMFDALIQTGERLKTEAGVRAVVLSGEGRSFCAGLDTSNFAAMASGEKAVMARPASRAKRWRKWFASMGMSSRRARSGGRRRLTTLRR